MKDKINVAELIKDCPKGMELDCTIFEGVVFHDVVDRHFPIRVRREQGGLIELTANGCIKDKIDAKCVIFPKGKTTWEGFHRPFKDGDIIYIRDEYSDATFTYVAILKQIDKGGQIYSHCFYNYEDAEFSTDDYLYDVFRIRFATEEEKAKLFQAIKDNGYKWDNVTKVLYKIVEPKFKIGDIIKDKCNLKWKVIDVNRHYYEISLVLSGTSKLLEIKAQDDYELVPNKFDITTLKPFDKVLVRDFDNTPWEIEWFSRLLDGKHFKCFDLSYTQCIPYEENKHLLGKKDDCDEYFKTWEE